MPGRWKPHRACTAGWHSRRPDASGASQRIGGARDGQHRRRPAGSRHQRARRPVARGPGVRGDSPARRRCGVGPASGGDDDLLLLDIDDRAPAGLELARALRGRGQHRPPGCWCSPAAARSRTSRSVGRPGSTSTSRSPSGSMSWSTTWVASSRSGQPDRRPVMPPPPDSRDERSYEPGPLATTAAFAAIFVLCVTAVQFAPGESSTAAWWPAAGVGTGLLALSPRRRWPTLLACSPCSSPQRPTPPAGATWWWPVSSVSPTPARGSWSCCCSGPGRADRGCAACRTSPA